MALVKDYLKITNELKEKYGEKSIVLMQVGSFFEVYATKKNNEYIGSNILDFSNICDMAISEKKTSKINGCPVVMAGFGVSQLDKYVNKLNSANYTIAIYAQDKQEKNTTRSLVEIISPSTFICDNTEKISNNVMCVWLEKIPKSRFLNEMMYVGIACVDNLIGDCYLSEYNSENIKGFSVFDNLEKQFSVYSPNEFIIISRFENSYVNDILQYINVKNIKTHVVNINEVSDNATYALNSEKQKYQFAVLEKTFPTIDREIFIENFKSNTYAVQSLIYLINFLSQHNPKLIEYLKYPQYEYDDNKLNLENHSLKQLNIISDDRHKGKLGSVSSFLNNCITNMGIRSFNYSLLSPSCDIQYLKTSYDETEYFNNKLEVDTVRNMLKGICDLNNFNRKLVFKKINIQNIVNFYNSIQKVLMLNTYLDKHSLHIFINRKFNTKKIYDKMINIINFIETRFNKSLFESYNYDIQLHQILNLDFYTSLQNLINNSNSYFDHLSNIIDELNRFIESMDKTKKKNVEYIKIKTTPKSPPQLVSTKRRIELLEKYLLKHKNDVISCDLGNKKSIKLSEFVCGKNTSSKSEYYVTSNIIKEICVSIFEFDDKCNSLSNELFDTFICDMLGFQNDIQEISSFVEYIDTLQNKSYIAKKYNYCKPNIDETHEKSFINVTSIRHPLIEQIQLNEIYVTNDIKIGQKQNGLLLYGTNAVGKTSFIKAIGISIVMAQAGLYVPCEKFIYKPYTKLFTRILGNDNLFKGLSTFAVEMTELNNILVKADQNSLVLGDEVCSGTEIDSAKSIFTACISWLSDISCTFMFATHLHEINDYEEIKTLKSIMMKHMQVTYDKSLDCLVYDRKLKDGAGNNMYGLEVCKSLNLPETFINKAYDIRNKYSNVQQNLLANKSSKYNSEKLRSTCEICGAPGKEIHHLNEQKYANHNNYINTHHKNHKANLINLCEQCHDKIHKEDINYTIKKTTLGYKLIKK